MRQKNSEYPQKKTEAEILKQEGIPLYSSEITKELKEEEIRDADEARDKIQEILAKGYLPIVTVPKKYEDVIKKQGLTAHKTILKIPILAGTLATRPLLPKTEKRIIVVLKNIKKYEKFVTPRITGEDKTFRGVVIFRSDKISPEDITIIDPDKIQEKNGIYYITSLENQGKETENVRTVVSETAEKVKKVA
jgi:hypothetical protein